MVNDVNNLNTPFPVVDADPHFNRVIRYFRPTDYGLWAAGTVAAPAILYGLEGGPNRMHARAEMADSTLPRGMKPHPSGRFLHLRSTLRMTTFLGFAGGFLLAYQNSSLRLWGWKENEREQERDHAELSELARQGKPLYGETDLPEYIQGVAHRNSMWSQLKFGVLPWFNFVNHQHHGTDPAKYKEDA